ncbi:protease inhibitor I9 family protein [Streptomyces europaeiscabiei]|uniref:protease inhibitor I9 family protein n=1 Tax=Streptomyces europaeiscabiei TaxID=146819 RepID=UPI002E124362|nr:protease inhibitor I9 family protein [Streptomyces europaeiscabiei]
MTHHHIRPRAAAALLAPLLGGALTLTAAIAPTFAADANSTGSGCSYDDDTYIVKLADAPVAAYEGGLPRLKRTAPAAGRRLDADSATVEKYVAHLDDRRERILAAVPGVESLYDYAYTFNGFAAELTGGQAAKLAATPGVVSVTRNTVAPLTSAGPDHGPGAGAGVRAKTYVRVEAGDKADADTEAEVPSPEAQQPPSPLKDGRHAGPSFSGARDCDTCGSPARARSAITGPAAAPAAARTPHTASSKASRTTGGDAVAATR